MVAHDNIDIKIFQSIAEKFDNAVYRHRIQLLPRIEYVAEYPQGAFIVGNGTGNARSNALIVDWDGSVSATTFKNSDGTLPTFIPVTTRPANTTACSLYVDADGKFYIVTGT